jgi:hypothetical protein
MAWPPCRRRNGLCECIDKGVGHQPLCGCDVEAIRTGIEGIRAGQHLSDRPSIRTALEPPPPTELLDLTLPASTSDQRFRWSEG